MSSPQQTKQQRPLTVSVSKSLSSDVRSHREFYPTEFDPYLILDHVWSPIIWREGVRRSEHFERCELLALDFDEGWSLERAREFFAGFWHVIATTRNHGKDKNGIVCDRFRVILKLQIPIACASALAATLSRIKTFAPIDGSCKDAARLFFPCSELVSVSQGLSWTPEPSPPPQKRPELPASQGGEVPPWLMRKIMAGAPAGNRSNTAYKIGCDAARCGVSVERLSEAFLTSPLKDYVNAGRNGHSRATRAL